MQVRATPAADRIVFGKVRTLDEKSTVAEAIAVADGDIIAVGDRETVLKTRDAGTEVRDFGDKVIIPGFNDTHAHIDSPGMQFTWPSLSAARSIEDVLDRIRGLAAEAPPGTWIVTMPVGKPIFYFDGPSALAEKRLPTRQEIDSVAPDHPVYVASPSGYWAGTPVYSALNTLGLKLNGIDRHTVPAAKGIEIQRDANGEPTGILVEHNMANLSELVLLPAVPKFTYQHRIEGVRRGMKLYHAKGTTSIYEGHGCSPALLAAFRELRERGELSMRVGAVVSPTWGNVEDAERAMRDTLVYARGAGIGDAMLRVSGIFITYGGDPVVNRLSQQHPEYAGWSGRVFQANNASEFEALCMLAGKYDLRVHAAVSDRLHELLPIMERVAMTYPIGRRRWVLEHVNRVRAEDLRRVRELGIGISLIPAYFLWKNGRDYFKLEPAELDYLSPARQLIELGVHVSAGTDAYPYDPLTTLWLMTTRQERVTGRVLGEGGRVGNEAALRLLTVAGAWLTFEEHVKGPLAPGYLADLAVLSGDPLETQGDALRDIECVATMVGGRWVHGG